MLQLIMDRGIMYIRNYMFKLKYKVDTVIKEEMEATGISVRWVAEYFQDVGNFLERPTTTYEIKEGPSL